MYGILFAAHNSAKFLASISVPGQSPSHPSYALGLTFVKLHIKAILFVVFVLAVPVINVQLLHPESVIHPVKDIEIISCKNHYSDK